MRTRRVDVMLLLLWGILACSVTAKAANKTSIYDHCLGGPDSNLCLKYVGPIQENFCGNGVGLRELKFVCKPGTTHAGWGWDIWCRTQGNSLCNIHEHDACPDSGQDTQWTADDHCTQQGGSPNWNPSQIKKRQQHK